MKNPAPAVEGQARIGKEDVNARPLYGRPDALKQPNRVSRRPTRRQVRAGMALYAPHRTGDGK